MDKIALVYSFSTHKTSKTADKLLEYISEYELERVNVETLKAEELGQYNYLIFGVPTWNDGELPNYWDEFIPDLEDMDLSGKKIAIYGGGDQKMYPENFVDGIGLMADIVEACGAQVVGHVSPDGFSFEGSKAFKHGVFVGLPIDYENMLSEIDERLSAWSKQILQEFKA